VVTLQTRASVNESGKCVDCGRYLGRNDMHFHSPPAERVHKVWSIGEWGDAYLARGTHDVEVAKAAVVRHIIDLGEYDEEYEVPAYVDRMHADVGWWRCNPCVCGLGPHQFDMGRVDGPGSGNFKAVYFSD
jgi:hypothetical protein